MPGACWPADPCSGVALFTDDTPVDKFQNGIHLLDADELPAESQSQLCQLWPLRTGLPGTSQVHLIGRCVEFDQLDEAGEFHPEACFECGLCAFVCPAGRPLVQLVKLASSIGGDPHE